MQKNEVGPLSQTICKNELKIDHRLKWKIIKLSEVNIDIILHDLGLNNMDMASKI